MDTSHELALLDKAFNANPCLMAISTIPDGRYVKVNRCFEECTGYTAQEVIGQTSVKLNILDADTRQMLLDMFIEQGILRNQINMYTAKDGTVRIGLFSADSVFLSGEQYLMTTVKDITDQKKLEEEVSKLERMNLIGQMAATVAHEVRNPLTAVRGFLDLFSKKEELKVYNEFFKIMLDELDRANEIVSEFLSVSKAKGSIMKKDSLNTILKELQPLLIVSGFHANGNVRCELEPVPDISLYKQEIRQLILT